jgi:hypothetical protein
VPEDTVEPDSEGADEGPDLGEDDYADVPEEMAAEVAAETTDEPDDADAEANADDQDDDGDDASTDTLTSGTSVGDVYCNALGMGATLARERKGAGIEDREETVDEYADMARQLELDDFVDEWVEAHGGAGELSPGQGILVGTSMFAMAVLVDDPTLADELATNGGGEA